eukprot:scpid95979/ scgid10609/ 
MDFKLFLLLTICVFARALPNHYPGHDVNIANNAAVELEAKRLQTLEHLESVLKQMHASDRQQQQVNVAQDNEVQETKAASDATDTLSIDDALKTNQDLSDTDLSELLKADDGAEKAAGTNTADAKPSVQDNSADHVNSATGKLSIDEPQKSSQDSDTADLPGVLKTSDYEYEAAKTNSAETKPGMQAAQGTFKIKDSQDSQASQDGDKDQQPIAKNAAVPATSEDNSNVAEDDDTDDTDD